MEKVDADLEFQRERRLEDLQELRDQSVQEERNQEETARDVSLLGLHAFYFGPCSLDLSLS